MEHEGHNAWLLDVGILIPVGTFISVRNAYRGKGMSAVNAFVKIEHSGPSKYGSHTHLLEEAICWDKFLAPDTTLAFSPGLRPGDSLKGGDLLDSPKHPASNCLFSVCPILRGESRVKAGTTNYKSL